VQLVLATARTVLIDFNPPGVVAAVLLSGVVSLLALCTGQSNHRAVSSFSRHTINFLEASRTYGMPLLLYLNYSRILVTIPAPTVRPPSRMAKLEPCSSATGVISSTSRLTRSPGITISTPSGKVISPVTSSVRM